MDGKIKIVEISHQRRCLAATRHFQAGELLMISQPYACTLAVESQFSRCATCFEDFDENEPILCPSCRQAAYCSHKCSSEDEDLHLLECIMFQKTRRLLIPTARLVLKILLRLARERSKNTMVMVKGLLDHNSARTSSEMHQFELLAENLHAIIRQHAHLPYHNTDFSPSFITRLLGKVSCNAFSICDGEMNPIGKGLYLDAVYANHSCRPNCVTTFVGKVLNLRTCLSVHKGDEVTIGYIDLAQPSHDRIAELQRGYFFSCTCTRCSSPRASVEDAAIEGYKCPKCDALCITHTHTTSYSEEQLDQAVAYRSWQQMSLGEEGGSRCRDEGEPTLVCLRCGATRPFRPSAARVAELKRQVQEAERLLGAAGGQGGEGAAERLLSAALAGCGRRLRADAGLARRCRDGLLRAALARGAWARALAHAEAALPGYDLAHPPGSPLPALQRLLLAKLRLHLAAGMAGGPAATAAAREGAEAAALGEARWARRVLAATHGPGHPLMRAFEELGLPGGG